MCGWRLLLRCCGGCSGGRGQTRREWADPLVPRPYGRAAIAHGVEFVAIGYGDLLAMKRAAWRPLDTVDIAELERVRRSAAYQTVNCGSNASIRSSRVTSCASAARAVA